MHHMSRCLTVCLFLAGLSGPTAAEPAAATIALGDAAPSGLAFADGLLWVADRRADVLTAYAIQSGRKVREVASPCRECSGLAADGDRLWCLDGPARRIHEMRAADGVSVRRLDIACSLASGLAFDGRYLWVGCPRKDRLTQIDPGDGTALRRIDAPFKSTSGLAWGDGYLYVVDRARDRLYMVDPERGWVYNSLALAGPYPRGAAWDGQNVWVADYQRDVVRPIRIHGRKLVRLGKPRRLKVTFTHEVRNGGPARLDDVEVALALPVDSPGQKLLDVTIPHPDDAVQRVTDRFGQEFARIGRKHLNPGETFRARLVATVELRRAEYFLDPAAVEPLSHVPEELARLYLPDEEKYLLNHPRIRNVVDELVAPNDSALTILYKIYYYVIDHMSYSLSGGWNAAPLLLERKTGSCSEYTILTVALLRAAGIPARYVGAYVVRGEDASVDYVFHRWAEAWVPGIGWVPVDANRGDKRRPADRARGIGRLQAQFLINTRSGGNSEVLGWQYNSRSSWKQKGLTDVEEETFAEWEPAE